MELLARTDELHGFLNGPATKKILEREYWGFGHEEYRNICQISVAHLYNLRKSPDMSGWGWARLDAGANKMSDNEFAERMVKARSDLFDRISNPAGGLPEAGLISYPISKPVQKKERVAKRKKRLL